MWGVVAILIAVLWAGALGMLLSGINVYMKDVAHIVDILLILLMWASPIVYFWQFAVSALRKWVLPGKWICTSTTLSHLL